MTIAPAAPQERLAQADQHPPVVAPVQRLPWQPRLVRTLVLTDLAAAGAAAVLALGLRFWVARDEAPALDAALACVLPLLWVTATALNRAYEPRFLGTGSEEWHRVANAGVRLTALVAVLAYVTHSAPARGFVLVALPATLAFSLIGRLVVRARLHARQRTGVDQHRLVIIGPADAVLDVADTVRSGPDSGLLVVGACVTHGETLPVVRAQIPVLGGLDAVLHAVHQTGADTVAVTPGPGVGPGATRRIAWQLQGLGVDLLLAPSIIDVAGPRVHVRPYAGLPLLHVEEPELTGGRRVTKTVLDRAAAALALLLLAPVLALVALAVRLDSAGPVLFRQRRIGRDGLEFTMLKFRSMRRGSEQLQEELREQNERAEGLLFKMRADPRVTRVGRVLRRYSLDELPQLINVVTGRMSLVGPRPPLPSEVERYGDDVRRRLLVRPGLTGLWQVSGRSDLAWDQSVRLDLHYVENWSLALDASILLRTVRAVFSRTGAY